MINQIGHIKTINPRSYASEVPAFTFKKTEFSFLSKGKKLQASIKENLTYKQCVAPKGDLSMLVITILQHVRQFKPV